MSQTLSLVPRVFVVLACLFAGALAGCGGSSDADPNLVPVRGKVTYKGQPVSGGTIAFVSKALNNAYTGTIKPDGTYELKASGSAFGALPDDYQVGVTSWKTPPTMDADGNPTEGVLAFEDRFTDPTTSEVTVKVEQGGGPYDIDLK